MDMHDYDPIQPDEEQEETKQKMEQEDDRFPYQDFYGPDFREEDSPRRSRRGKRDHVFVPLTVFAGLLVVGCLAIVAVSQMDGSPLSSILNTNGMQIQSDSSSGGSQSAGSPDDGPATATAVPSEEEEEDVEDVDAVETAEEVEQEDDVPEVTLGSGTVLHISETPESEGTTSIVSEKSDGALTYQEIYEKVIPSVVSITSTVSGGIATGTGIIMSEDGYIITNYHVIEGATKLEVLLYDDTQYVAALVGSDETSDLAVLKIDAEDLQPAEFGSSNNLRVGDEVVAIGDPLGTELRGTMTNGIISAINRDLTVNDRTMTLIQTNAALNSGNSGGPLINCYGQVIGINTMKMSSYYSSVEGLGFAIPISTAKPIIDELIEKGYVSGRPAIGITIASNMNDAWRAYFDIPEGVVVQGVQENSDAAAAGLMAGDVIIAFEDTTVTSSEELRTLLNEYVAGETVRLTIWRNGETFNLSITLMDAHDNS